MNEVNNNKKNEMIDVITSHSIEKSVNEQFTNAQEEIYSSVVDDGSIDSKTIVFNAITNTDYSLRDFVGKTIDLVNFVAHKVEIYNEKTGEMEPAIRCVLVDKNNKTYGTVSNGINQAMTRLLGIVGHPSTWDKPLKISVSEKKSNKGYRFLSIGLV